MPTTNLTELPLQTSKWALFIYTFLSFYILGLVLALYCITYPRFDDVHDNWQAFMSLYNHKMTIFLKIPSILWLLSAVSTYFFSPKFFQNGQFTFQFHSHLFQFRQLYSVFCPYSITCKVLASVQKLITTYNQPVYFSK